MSVINDIKKYKFWTKLSPNTILFRKNRNDVIQVISNIIKDNRKNPIVTDSSFRKIRVYIDRVMFDGLASEYSDGFFDEDDMPPPELWLDFKDNYLIAIIPKNLEPIVDDCVKESISESIEWD